jgi:hypothetical protein
MRQNGRWATIGTGNSPLPTRTVRWTATAVALLSAATAVGCGGQQASTTVALTVAPATAPRVTAKTPDPTSATPTTHAAIRKPAVHSGFIARGEAICERRNSELAASAEPQRRAIERRAIEELHRLVPPPKLARAWAQVVAYSEAELRAARTSDTQHFRLLAAASRAGLKHCGALE